MLENAQVRTWVIFYGQSKYLCKEDYIGLVKTPSSPPERHAAAPRPTLPPDYWTDGFTVFIYSPDIYLCIYVVIFSFFTFSFFLIPTLELTSSYYLQCSRIPTTYKLSFSKLISLEISYSKECLSILFGRFNIFVALSTVY